MRKGIISITAVMLTAVFALMLVSCSSNSTTNSQNGQSGQGYERADLMGQVSAIAGNEVTIKVIELPAMPSFSQGQQRSPRPSRSPSASDAGNQQPQGSQLPEKSPAASGQNQAPSDTSGQNRRSGSSMTFTGEEKTIVIPVGVPITSVQRSNTGTNGAQNGSNTGNSTPSTTAQTVQLDFKDIKVGDILSIWYSEKDKTAIARVSIQSTTSNSQNGSGFQGGGNFPEGGGNFSGGGQAGTGQGRN